MGNSSKKEDKQLDDVRLNALKIATNMTEEEIREWHEIFLIDCPNGLFTKKQFIKIYNDLFPNGKTKKFAEKMFKVFDTDNSKAIDFSEYLIACSLVYSDDPKKKLDLAFQIYDSDRNGKLTKKEVADIIQSISELQEAESLNKAELTSKIVQIMQKCDTDCDGTLSKTEFLNIIMSDAELLTLLNF